MKKSMRSAGLAVAGAMLATVLTAFLLPGGDSYSIYINSERVVEQYVTRQTAVPEVSLPASSRSARIKAYYSHCGKIGTGRTLSLKSEGRTLKEWSFGNVGKENEAMMEIAVSEVLAAGSRPFGRATLVYASNELREGRVLATLVADGSSASAK